MDQREYKQLTSSANTFSRAVLEETVCVLRPANPSIARKLQSIIDGGPIEKPKGYQGGPETDFFRVQLEQSELELIVEAFGDLEASNVSATGETTPKASHYASMLDIWNAAT